MPEVSGSEFLESANRTNPDSREYKLADDQNRHITVELHSINRKELFDELNRLPAEFINVMMSPGGEDVDLENVDDPEELDLDIDGGELLAHLDGSVIDVFETLFYKSATHPDLTSLDMETLADKLGFEVLFEVGSEVIDISLEKPGEIKRFREPDSAKSS